jgi:DNA mismatch repair protein MutL
MHITVNGRAIAPRGQVGAIVEEAYHTLLMKGRFPVVMLHIHLHPAAVDVNVHPTKSEVKFRNPLLVARTLGRAVRDAVQQTVVIQGWREPDGTPDDTGQPPARLEESGAPADVAASLAAETAGAPPAANASFDMTEFLPVPSHRLAADDTGSPSQLARQAELPRAADPGGPLQAVLSHTERLNAGGVEDRDKDPDAALEPLPEEARLRELPAPFAPRDLAPPAEPTRLPTAGSQAATAPLSDAAVLPPLRALAQLAQTYLLTEGPDGALYLIDQHAAHERVTYERLLAQHGAGVVQSQALLMPQYVALPPNAQQALLAAADDLAAWGFALNETSGGIQVLAVPAGLVLEELTPMLNDLAGHLSVGGGRTPSDRHDLLLATLACHTSVRAGQTLTAFEQQGLIDQLAGCEGPRTCPHGRPTVIVITKHQLERQFGRLGA